MALGVDLEAIKGDYDKLKSAEEESELGGDVELVFILPDGSEDSLKFKLGQTVEYVKAFLNNRHGLPMHMALITPIDGRSLMDPLSLSDCRAISASKPNHVKVSLSEGV